MLGMYFGHVCFYLRHKHKLLILSLLSDFVTCESTFYNEGSISQFWNTVGRSNLVFMLIRHTYTQTVNNVTLA